MATMEMTDAAPVADRAVEHGVNEEIEELEQAAEFVARQVLDRGATFFDG